MSESINIKTLSNILFVDIETAGSSKNFEGLPSEGKNLWCQRAKLIRRRNDEYRLIPDEELYLLKAGIFAEFARVVCISVAFLKKTEEENCVQLKTKSFFVHDESQLIKEFFSLLVRCFGTRDIEFLCGHNIREFDIPFLCRRARIHGIDIPACIDFTAKKAWQVKNLIDTMELWKFGDYKNYSSLALLCYATGIPSPKQGFDGAAVHIAYWNGARLSEIISYCEADVKATARLFLKLSGHYKLKTI